MIGIICAMQEEVDGFAPDPGHPDSERFRHIRVGGHEAVIASCGLGKVQAAMTATIMLERWQCTALVSAGTAGGLAGVEPMQVVVGTELVQHDYGRSRGAGEIEIYRPGLPPLPDYYSDDYRLRVPQAQQDRWLALTREFSFVRFGGFASGDTFVNDPDTRARLVGLGALAVDMECAAVAQVAEFHGLPWLVAKGISDAASSESHNDFLAGLAEASRRSALVVAALMPAIAR